MKYFLHTIIISSLFLPFIGSAQDSLYKLGGTIVDILQDVIVVLIGIAVLVFLFSLIRYLVQGKDSAKRTESRKYMVFGIIAIFVMTSVWGLVSILNNSTNLDPSYELPDAKEINL